MMRFIIILLPIMLNYLVQAQIKWETALDSAMANQQKQKYAKAEEWGNLALKAYQTQVPLKDTNYVILLVEQFRTCYYAGKYPQSLYYLRQDSAWVVQNLGRQNDYYGYFCTHAGLVYQKLGQFELAEQQLKEAKTVRGQILGTNHPNYANACDNMAGFYHNMGNYTQAEVLYLQAKEIRERVLGTQDPDYARSCNNMASVYQNMGRYDLSEQLFTEARIIYRKTFGVNNQSYANVSGNLASLYIRKGDFSKAESLLIEAKMLRAKNLGTKHPNYANSCISLGGLYASMERYTLAESLYKEALDIRKQTFGEESIDYAQVLYELGILYTNSKEYDKAEFYHKSAKDLREKKLGNNNFLYAQSCFSMARLYKNMNRKKEAATLFNLAVELKINEIQNNFAFLSEAEKENYIKANQGYFNDFYKALYEGLPLSENAYNLVLATKGMILGSIKNIRKRIYAQGDTVLQKQYDALQAINKKILRSVETPVTERSRKGLRLDSLQQSANDLEKEISLKSESFKSLTQEYHVTATMLQKKLKKNEACIEIIRFKAHAHTDSVVYLALILTQESIETIILSTPQTTLEKEYFINYSRSLRHSIQDPYSYPAYWEKIALYVRKKHIQRVYLSPDGVYNRLNVEALLNPATNKYVFDEITIEQVTNTKTLLNPKREIFIQNAFLLGRPDYNPVNQELSNGNRGSYADLPATETEVENIAGIIGKRIKTQKVLGIWATKDTLLSQNPSVLHLATHGFFDPKTVLSTQKMLQSGLVLAQGKTLTAFEAMQMDLSRTELVVLSACETGLGDVSSGEGVYGLQRAFKVAGTRYILMSLWKVNDEATQLLMTFFYKNWLEKKLTVRQAFREAKNQLRETYKNPRFWAAFVMIE